MTENQPHIPSHFYACTPINAKKRFTFEKTSITSIVFRKNIKVAFWLMIWSFWSLFFLQFVLFTKIFIYQYYQISYYYATVPLFHGNFRKKSKFFWKTAGVTQLFSKVHLKKCYCDARYVGKSVGDPLKIVQNESLWSPMILNCDFNIFLFNSIVSSIIVYSHDFSYQMKHGTILLSAFHLVEILKTFAINL